MLRMFLERMAPASSIAKPACMKMTSMAANRIHMVSIPWTICHWMPPNQPNIEIPVGGDAEKEIEVAGRCGAHLAVYQLRLDDVLYLIDGAKHALQRAFV
jgi:hypothetical protein